MTTYKIAAGHDQQALVAAFPVECWSTGIEYRAPRRFAANGAVYVDGAPSVELVFDFLTETELAAVDAAAGVSEAVPSADVTLYMRLNDGTEGYYNGTIIRPTIRRTRFLQYENVRYLVTRLEAIAAP